MGDKTYLIFGLVNQTYSRGELLVSWTSDVFPQEYVWLTRLDLEETKFGTQLWRFGNATSLVSLVNQTYSRARGITSLVN